MGSSIVCRKCQKVGRAACTCWLAGWAAVVPIRDARLNPAHAGGALTSTTGSTGTMTISISAISATAPSLPRRLAGPPQGTTDHGSGDDAEREHPLPAP